MCWQESSPLEFCSPSNVNRTGGTRLFICASYTAIYRPFYRHVGHFFIIIFLLLRRNMPRCQKYDSCTFFCIDRIISKHIFFQPINSTLKGYFGILKGAEGDKIAYCCCHAALCGHYNVYFSPQGFLMKKYMCMLHCATSRSQNVSETHTLVVRTFTI